MLKTYRALIGTVVKNASVTIKFEELLYTTDKEAEQELLESSEYVVCISENKVTEPVEVTEPVAKKKKK